MRNKVTVKILDSTYTILADESEDYVQSIARKVDAKTREVMAANEHASLTMAAVLTSFTYCDEIEKVLQSTNNLRSQIREYIDEVSKYRAEAEEARRQLTKLQNENAELRLKLR